ncbi:MAG: hypothetical protein PHX54_13710 [Lentimicrobiaceae bacterium]|nr:hypothetical protein [Lentimicrobiaceae bacterium]
MTELRQEIARLSEQIQHKLDKLIDNKLNTAIEVDIVLSRLSQLYDKIEVYRQSLPRQGQADENAEKQIENTSSPVSDSRKSAEEEDQPILPPPPLAPEPPPLKTYYEIEKSVPPPPPSDEKEKADNDKINPEPQREEPIAHIPVKESSLPESAHISGQASLPATESPAEAVPLPKPKPLASTGDLFATTSLGEKFKNDTPSLNDKITSDRKDFSLADSMHLKPIADLKSYIGINEKFQFVNDLFDGSTSDYNQAISHLNSCQNGDEARAALHTLLIKHSWSDENRSLDLLRSYVTRRYL